MNTNIDVDRQRTISAQEIQKALIKTREKGVDTEVVLFMLHKVEKIMTWQFKYEYGADDQYIQGLRKAAEDSADALIKEQSLRQHKRPISSPRQRL